MSAAPILPFRFLSKNVQSSWTGACIVTQDEDHGLVRIEEDRILIQVTRSRKVVNMSAMGSVDSKYDNLPLEEHAIAFSDLSRVSLRVPTWKFWHPIRVVFHVREMRVLEGLPRGGAAEFSVPVSSRDKVLANAFVVQCNLAIGNSHQPLGEGFQALPH